MSTTLASQLKYRDLCQLFEKLISLKGLKKFDALQKYTKKCRELASTIKAQNKEADTSLFPLYRLILPSLERERGPYGLKTKNLSLLYVRVFCLGKNTPNANKLTSFKKPIDGSTTSKYDDLAERAYQLLKTRLQSTEQSSLTIEQVNEFLDQVSEHNETNQNKDELFVQLSRRLSGLELKWLTRILLKDLKLGIAQKKAFEAIHPDAEELFNVTSSLRRVCERFADDSSSNNPTALPIAVETFSHVKPMLLERFRIELIGRLFADEPHLQYYVQTKFDGERSQMHMRDGRFKYFTRQGFDVTGNASYGETAESGGFLTSNIAPLLNKNCRSIILDGELMGWHKLKKSFGSKGLSYDIKKVTDKSYHQPCFVAYDVLLYNDEPLLGKPYYERLEILESAFAEKEGVLVRCKTSTVSNVEQLTEFFNVALDNDDEGIVVKERDCLYRPNVRERSGCYKIKADYSDDLVQDLDLIILGGYYGQGRCGGQISIFLVGLASPPTNRSGLPSEFTAIVQVKSGLSGDDLKRIQQQLKPHWKDKKPYGVVGPKSHPPDVWIAPKQSLILQLRATEITRTQNYPFGYSLRFPRVLKVRLDKSWRDACSTTEFLKLIKDRGSIQKLTKRKVTANDIDDATEEKEPKVRKTATAAAAAMVYDNFIPTRSSDETVRVSRLFEGKEFHVINGDAKLKKSDVENLLLEHTAKIVANAGDRTFCVLVGNPEVLKAQSLINRKKYDVASLDWLRRATQPENLAKVADFHPWELYSASPRTKQKLNASYDEYMDSYFEDADTKSLERSMKLVKATSQRNPDFSVMDMKELDELLFPDGKSPHSIFRGVVGYFANPNDAQKYLFSFMSGQSLEVLSSSAQYIFVDNVDSRDILQEYIKELENGEKSIKIVNSRWIGDCFEDRKILPIDSYLA